MPPAYTYRPATLDDVIAIDAEARTRAKAGLLTESAPLD